MLKWDHSEGYDLTLSWTKFSLLHGKLMFCDDSDTTTVLQACNPPNNKLYKCPILKGPPYLKKKKGAQSAQRKICTVVALLREFRNTEEKGGRGL